jgi:hypothetical protein
LAPEARFERETSTQRETTPYRDIPPYRPSGDARNTTAALKPSYKAPTFAGTDLEDVTVWIWLTELYFRNIRTPPDDYFNFAMFHLEGDTCTFIFDLVRKNNGLLLSWETFKAAIRQRYEKPAICSDILRQWLKQVKYEGPSQMIEYCTAFRTIKQQVQDMTFEDKLRNFLKPLPPNG